MTIARVAAGATATGTTSVSPAFGQATAGGNLLVAQITVTGSSLGLISTTASGWLIVASAGTTVTRSAIGYKPNCAAGETAPVFTCTGGTLMTAVLSEWSGAATTSPLDKTAAAAPLSTNPVVTNSAATDTNSADVCLIATLWSNSKSATVTFADAWTPSGGTAGTNGNTGGTKAANASSFPTYLLNGFGGGAADILTETATPSTGTSGAVAYSEASFLPEIATAVFPNRISVLSQAVNRAATFFTRVPWHERPGGLVVPARRKLIPV